MTESEVLPFLGTEWRSTPDIALAVYEAEGCRGRYDMANLRVLRALRRLESRGKVERLRSRPVMWRLVQ